MVDLVGSIKIKKLIVNKVLFLIQSFYTYFALNIVANDTLVHISIKASMLNGN